MADSDDRLVELMDRAVRLLTLLVTRGLPLKEQTQKEQIKLLSSVGFKPREIADLLETTPNTVSVALSTARKQAAAKDKGGTK
jgi:DNA-directed RNA polymerase specialized sigma24 family protein